jgi:hypothetical protein
MLSTGASAVVRRNLSRLPLYATAQFVANAPHKRQEFTFKVEVGQKMRRNGRSGLAGGEWQ